MKMTMTLLSTTVALAASAAASAGDFGELRQQTVKLGDLNLDSDQGAKVALRRITAGARFVCEQPGTGEIYVRWQERQCIDTAVAVAVQHVDSYRLTAFCAFKTGAASALRLVGQAGQGPLR